MDPACLISMNWKVLLVIMDLWNYWIQEILFRDVQVRIMELGGYSEVSWWWIICGKPVLQPNLLGSIICGDYSNSITNQSWNPAYTQIFSYTLYTAIGSGEDIHNAQATWHHRKRTRVQEKANGIWKEGIKERRKPTFIHRGQRVPTKYYSLCKVIHYFMRLHAYII